MFSKSVLAAAALASTLALGFAGSAKADPYVSLGIGFGGPGPVGYVGGGYGGGYAYPYHHPRPWGYAGGYGYDGGYANPHYGPGYGGLSCGAGAGIARANGFRGVQPVDCSAPVYGYRGWKHGQPYDIRVSMRGNVVGVSPSYW